MESLFITHTTFPDGEISVQGKTEDGSLKFGFRTRDYFGWRDKAREWTGGKYMPVFLSNKEGKLI